MALWKRAAQGLSSLFGGSAHSSVALEDSVEDIRELMLDSLGDDGAVVHIQIARRIRYAQDLQSLWYLRGDLMAALSSLHGEERAREIMLQVSQEFQGLLPGGLASRPSPLA